MHTSRLRVNTNYHIIMMIMNITFIILATEELQSMLNLLRKLFFLHKTENDKDLKQFWFFYPDFHVI